MDGIVSFALRQRVVMLLMLAGMMICGLIAFKLLNIEA